MKKGFKAGIILFALAGALSACKGGVNGQKMDSTMVDRHARDSTSAQDAKAGEMAHDSSSAAHQPDSAKH
jgi:hypothetical protein